MGEPVTIAGRYHLDEKVGEGSFATVWRGRSIGGEGYTRRVAIKQLRPDLAADKTFVSTLAKLGGRLMDSPRPHVEGLLDVVREGPDCYAVTDWIDGVSLKRWVVAYHERSTPAPWGQLLAIGADVLLGLHGLHSRPQPIVHGSVLSTSIRLERAGIPILTRLGVRSALDAAKMDEARARAEGLRLDAPEGQLTPSADVFGVGLVIYTVLAGATEFGDLPDDLQKRLLAGKPVDLNLIRSDIPAVVLRTIERALRPDPRQRFDSAIDMARSLHLVLRSLAENTDPLVLARSIESVLPSPKPAKPSTPPPPRKPAPKDEKLGIKPESTDQLDLRELNKLAIDE
jgi:serine/threonine protein kinase